MGGVKEVVELVTSKLSLDDAGFDVDELVAVKYVPRYRNLHTFSRVSHLMTGRCSCWESIFSARVSVKN